MGGLNDPHIEAMMETDARHPRHEEEPPPSFKNEQFWIVLGAGAVGILAWIAYIAFR